MATDYIDPNEDIDAGSAIPGGQRTAGGEGAPAKQPAANPQRDQTQSLDVLNDGGTALDELHRQTVEGTEGEGQGTPAPDDKSGGEGGNGKPDDSPEGGKPEEDGKGGEGVEKRVSAIPSDEDGDNPVDTTTTDELEDIKPPEGTSPKTAASWDSFKAKARELIDAANAKATEAEKARAEIEAQNKELEEKSKKALTEEQEKEIEELRKFRAATEIESAPELVSLDSKLTANTDTLLAKLKEAGMVDDQLKEIRKQGIHRIEWDELKKFMSPQLKQFVDAKVLQHINLTEERDSLYTNLKSKGVEYFEKKQAAARQAETERVQALDAAVTQYSEAKHFSFLKEEEIPKDATKEQKQAIEENNAFAKEMRDNIAEWKKNLDDPGMRAELLFGSVMAYKYLRDNKAALARVTALEKELKDVQGKYDRVKKASGSGRPASGARPAAPRPGSEITDEQGHIKSASEALDELAASHRS